MAGLVPANHALFAAKAWMPGIKPGMTLICWNQALCFIALAAIA